MRAPVQGTPGSRRIRGRRRHDRHAGAGVGGRGGRPPIVVDPCVGNGKLASSRVERPGWPFIERFRAAGFDPAEVDTVVHTHLHVDHLGWDTHRWATAGCRRSPAPAPLRGAELDAPADTGDDAGDHRRLGRADLRRRPGPHRRARRRPGDGLRLAPRPVTRRATRCCGSRAAAPRGRTGDTIHHPLQCARPEMAFVSDADPAGPGRPGATCWSRPARAALFLRAHFPTFPAAGSPRRRRLAVRPAPPAVTAQVA